MPANIAAHLSVWPHQWPKLSVLPSRGSSLPGTPILAESATGLQLVVEVAWGCPVGTDPAAWPWSDITADVQTANNGQISISLGKADEASDTQPAALSLTLLNISGNYSKGPQSAHYPYVRRDTPVRVRLIFNGVSYTRFMGRAVGWTPGWDSSGKYAIVTLAAAGSLRRLGQGSSPVQSTMRRAVPAVGSLVAYWPCEDGATSTTLASAIGGPPMQITGVADLATYSGFLCSDPLPTMKLESWYGAVPGYTNSGSAQIRFLMMVPSSVGVGDGARIISVATTGAISRVDVIYHTNATMDVLAYSGITQVFDMGATNFNQDDALMWVSLQWQPSGSDTAFALTTYTVNSTASFFDIGTATGYQMGSVVSVTVSPDGTMVGATIGQVSVQNQVDAQFSLSSQVNAFVGEGASTRLSRLCREQAETLSITGRSLTTMGCQLPDTFLNLLRACEYADGGILYDGLNSGLTYLWREGLENQFAAITFNAATSDIEHPVEPVDDDQVTMNSFTATRLNGGTYTFNDTTDALSVALISDYDDAQTVNVQNDSQLPDFASWQVHQRTVDDYRWPTLNIWLHHKPYLIQPWLNTVIGNRMDVLNLQTVRTQQDAKTVSLLLLGYSETIDQFTWSVVANASTYDTWRVAVYAADTGDTNPWVGRYESDGAMTVGDSPAGSTTITVATPSGPLWTTVADDFTPPLILNMGGYQVTVTNITGASSPQTFTVNATASDIPPGAAVSLWLPNVFART